MKQFVIQGIEREELKKELHLLKEFIKMFWNGIESDINDFTSSHTMNEEVALSRYDDVKAEIGQIERKLKKRA